MPPSCRESARLTESGPYFPRRDHGSSRMKARELRPYVRSVTDRAERAMSVRVGINGFGRTGRAAFRAAFERGAAIHWAGINDLMGVEMAAALLRHDSTYGPFPGTVEARDEALWVDGTEVPFFAVAQPAEIPWREVSAEVVIESTGLFLSGARRRPHRRRRREGHHLRARKEPRCDCGARHQLRRGLRPSPQTCCDLERLLHHELPGPVAKVLHDMGASKRGLMTTVHASTADQSPLDARAQGLPRRRGLLEQHRPVHDRRGQGASGWSSPSSPGSSPLSRSACRPATGSRGRPHR